MKIVIVIIATMCYSDSMELKAQDLALAAKSVRKRSGRDASSRHRVVLLGLMPAAESRR